MTDQLERLRDIAEQWGMASIDYRPDLDPPIWVVHLGHRTMSRFGDSGSSGGHFTGATPEEAINNAMRKG